MRDCPALLLFHTDSSEPAGKENCAIAAWHAIFAAETPGGGACMNHLIPQACNRSPEIREMLGLPDSQEVMAALTMGCAKYKYLRTIPRELTSLRFLD